MKRIAWLVMVGMLVCVSSGCIAFSGGAAPATRPLTPDQYTTLTNAAGDSWGYIFLSIIPLKMPYTQSAIDEALESKGADALVNVTVDNQHFYTGVLNIYRIKVQGTAVHVTAPTVEVRTAPGAGVEVRPGPGVEVRPR